MAISKGGVDIGLVEVTGSDVFDRQPLLSKQPITVAGHSAFYAQQQAEGLSGDQVAGSGQGQQGSGSSPLTPTVPVVAWQFRPGRWVIVRASSLPAGPAPSAEQLSQAWGPDVRSQLVKVAAAVRTGVSRQMPLPFRLAATDGPVSAVEGHSSPGGVAPGGSVGFDSGHATIGINVVRPARYTPQPAGSVPTAVGDYQGWLNADCGPVSVTDLSQCTLTFRAGDWQVTIDARGPGASVSAKRLVALGTKLSLASQPDDATSWFDGTTTLPS